MAPIFLTNYSNYMANISYIETEAKKPTNVSLFIPTDESIGAMLFDICGFNNPFGEYPTLYHNFKDGKIQSVSNMDEAQLLGIEDNGFLNGMVYYHLSQFFKFVGEDKTIFLAFFDCSENWDILQQMQSEANGKLFHIGVWTSQPIWTKNDDSVGFTPLIRLLQRQADEINGEIGKSTHSMIPLNILLFGNSNYVDGEKINYKQLPDAIDLECPKISVFLCQNGSPEIHKMQESNPLKSPVSVMGLVMGCLALCGAEESIASVGKCDLNKDEEFTYPEWGFGADGTPIDSIHRIWANITSSKGYIIPINYEEIEASYFLSSDQTLSYGDFCSLANNRVMHKCRRAMSTALLPYLHSNQLFTPGSKNIDASAIAIITTAINTVLDSTLRNRQGKEQIDGRAITFLENEDMLENDTLNIKLEVKPANYNGYISEEVSHENN